MAVDDGIGNSPSAGVVAKDMVDPLPPSARGQVKAAGLVNGNGHEDNRPISPEEAEQELRTNEQHGSTVHDFDPSMTPEQKKAQALKGVKGRLGPISRRIAERHEGGTEVATDIGGKDVKPSISLADVKAASEQEKGRADNSATGQPAIPGGLPSEVASAIPEWYKIGWRAQTQALLDSGGDIELARQQSLLSEFISESYYGGWYHNAAVIFFAVFASHYVTVFGGGFGWLFIILASCATYYQLSIKRVRHRARDDMMRELSKQRLFTDSESVDWMNNFLTRFWLIYEPVLSAVIVASVDQTLSASAPAGVDSMRMTHFTLGTKAPRIDFIRTHPGTENDVVVMDWKISFTPNDTADLTTRQAADKVNPKVVLTVKIGKGKVALSKDIIVEDVTFAGVMRIRLKLMNNYPHVQLVDLSFLEKPLIDFVAKPIGFDINAIPGLENFIDNQVHATLGPMMYDPNVFTINLEQLLSSAPIDTAIGVLQITVKNARALKGVKFGGGLPDPYISFGIGKRTGLAKTKIKHSTVNPYWNETKFLLINSLEETLTMDIFDYNDHRKDSELGTASVDLAPLREDAELLDANSTILLSGRPRGTVGYDLRYFPVLKAEKQEDGTEEPLPESKTGIVRITLHQAKDLDSRGGRECNPYAKIYLKGRPIHKAPTFKRNHNPMWETSTEFLVTEKERAIIGVKVIDNKGFATDPALGYVGVKLVDILAANARQQEWFPLSGASSGKIRMSASFRPVAMAGAINSSSDFRPPIGVVRIWFKKAVDLKNVEALTGGKSDPYVRVVRRGVIAARTLVHNNNLNPEIDEIVYCPVHNLSEILVMEVMDYQHNSKDRTLGVARLEVKDVAVEGTNKTEQPYISTGKIERTSRLTTDHQGKLGKGSLIYEAIFYPTIPLKGVKFQNAPNPTDQVKAKVKAEGQDDDDNQSTIAGSDNEDSATVNGDDEMSSVPLLKAEAIEEEGADVPASQTNGTAAQATSPGHSKNVLSNASFVTTGTGATTETTGTTEEGLALSKQEVLSYNSGVLVFNIVSGVLARRGARLEVAFDDAYWPNYSTEVARTNNQTWDEVGESFIRELGYSRIILRLNEAEKESREDIQAAFRTSLSEFLDQCLVGRARMLISKYIRTEFVTQDKPYDFTLTNEHGGNRSIVTISAKYVPVPIQLEMRETVNNTGIVRVDVLEGSGLKAADRNGKSDPYCEFYLGDEKIFTTQVQKKTLTPKWNEHFEMLVPSRVAAQCRVKVLDWDRLGKADKLGSGEINLVDIEPFQATKQTIPLFDSSGEQHGTIDIRLVFRPEFVARSRSATSTFVGTIAGGAATGVGSVVGGGAHIVGKGGKLAVGGVGAVAGGVGHVGKGVFSGVRSVVPGGRRQSATLPDGGVEEYIVQDGSAIPASVANETALSSTPSGPAGNVNGRITHTPIGGGNPDFGNLQVIVTEIQGVPQDEKVHVVLRQGVKQHEKSHVAKDATTGSTNVIFDLKTLPEAMVLVFSLVHKKVLGKDKELGSAELDVWSVIHPGQRTSAEVVLTTGNGDIAVTLNWTGTAAGAGANATPIITRSTSGNLTPDSPASQKSKSRFSMHRKREGTPS